MLPSDGGQRRAEEGREMADKENGNPTDRLLSGVLAMLVAERDDRLKDNEPRPSEVILADAGFTVAEIAALTGRKYETVKSALRRSKPAAAKRTEGPR